MLRKEVIFVCVVAISTFLVVTADTASHKELIGDNGEEEIPTTKFPKKIFSDEEYVNVDGEQEIATTELPKEKHNLTCASPPEIEGSISPRVDGNEHAVGTQIAYSCNYGYVSRNSRNHISICTVNETTGRADWTVPKIACIPRPCGDPGYVNNGRRIGNLFTFPNKVEFECEAGYKLVGMKARYCQAGGEWSGRLPACEPILCSVPPDLVNGELIYSSLEYGAELTYRCYLGYMETHREPRYCDEDGTWSGVAPECIETRCIKPIPPENGEVHFIGEPKVGSIATYSCNPGLKLLGASTTKCLITGQWTFGPPQCLSPCFIPPVENGEMSKLSVRQISRWRKEETYIPLSDGEHVDHNTKLSFHCNKYFSIVETDKILEDDRIDVTCYDGKWSRDLHCKQTSCLGDPPKMERGKARISGRTHGHTIWYKCDDQTNTKIPGNVTCSFGTWIGNTPQCISSTPCYSKDLTFPGLVKPSQKVVASSESFDITCKEGYRLSTSAKTVTCKRGKWNVTEDPCPLAFKDTEQGKAVIVPPGQLNVEEKSPSIPNHHNSNIVPPEECHCTYAGAGFHVQAMVRNRRLKDGDTVKKGRTVTFSCKGQRMLTWANGFRKFGNASMTCTTCRRWEVADNPDCKELERGGPFIILDDSLEIQPGGVVEVLIKKPITLRCVSSYYYPEWSNPWQPNVVVDYYTRRTDSVVHYFRTLSINEIGYDNAGIYACLFNPPGYFKRIVVDVRVKENKCPLLAANQFVTYSDGNEIGSWATFRCPENTNLVGDSRILCQNDGTWSSPEPFCRAIVCTFFPAVQDLKVSYSDDNHVGSRATFSCPTHATLVGSAISECRSNGIWSFARPYCLNKTTCAFFQRVSGLKIEYSNRNFPGSNASFSCSSEKVLNGPSVAVCLENGNWSHQTPSCEDKCSIEILSTSVKEVVVLDMSEVTDEFVPFGSTVPLTCEEKFIPEGNSTAVCGEQGRWKIGKFECVSGCRLLNIEPSSHLQVQPLKDSYRFGEQVTFTCPEGEKTTNDVERLMCLGQLTWSDSIPTCIKS